MFRSSIASMNLLLFKLSVFGFILPFVSKFFVDAATSVSSCRNSHIRQLALWQSIGAGNGSKNPYANGHFTPRSYSYPPLLTASCHYNSVVRYASISVTQIVIMEIKRQTETKHLTNLSHMLKLLLSNIFPRLFLAHFAPY